MQCASPKMVQWWIFGAERMCSVLACSSGETAAAFGEKEGCFNKWGNSATEFMSTLLFKIFQVCSVVFWEEKGAAFTSSHFTSFLALTAAVSKCVVPWSCFWDCWCSTSPWQQKPAPLSNSLSSTLTEPAYSSSWQPVINVKFNSTNFSSSALWAVPTSKRKVWLFCCGLQSVLLSTCWCDFSLLPPSCSSLLPSALGDSCVKVRSSSHPERKRQNREKAVLVRIAGHVSGRISPCWRQQRKCNIARANVVLLRKGSWLLFIASGATAWLPTNPLCT